MKNIIFRFCSAFLVLCFVVTMITPVNILATAQALELDLDAPASDGSFITLDATNSRYVSYSADATGEYKARVNGVVLGKKQGIELQPSTDYRISFLYRLEDIIDPGDNDDLSGVGCSYACRAPLICVFSGGNKSSVKYPKLEYVYDSSGVATTTESGRQNPWLLEKGKWYSFTITFKTDKNISGEGEWISLISYGGIKSSYRKLTVTESNSDTVVYSFADMPNIPKSADMFSETYNDTVHVVGKIYPEIRIGVGMLSSEITLDTMGARFYSYDVNENGKYTGRLNGLSVGKEHGIELKSSTKYNITFEYCVKDIIRPANVSNESSNSDSSGCSYACRTPLMYVYPTGNSGNPKTVYFDRYIKSNGVVTVDTSRTAFQSPWELIKGEWYSFSLDFSTSDTVEDDAVWFSLVTYGGMKSSYRNIVITEDNEQQKTYYLGELGDGYDINPMYTTVYSDANKNTQKANPAVEITVDVSDTYIHMDTTSDNKLDIRDLVAMKKSAAAGDYTAVSLSALKKMLLGIVKKNIASLQLQNSSPVLEDYMGFSAISQGFMYMPDLYGREYTTEQKSAFISRLKNSNVTMIRTYYDQGYAAQKKSDGSFKKDENGNLIWNWESAEMKGLYSWISMLRDNGITVVLNMSWNAAVLMPKTSYGFDNPFYGMTVSEVTAAYADWACRSIYEIVIKRGFTNVQYASVFTEPYATVDLYGKKISELNDEQIQIIDNTLSQTEWYPAMLSAFDGALKNVGIRDKIKILGPNVALRADLAAQPSGTTLQERIMWWVEEIDAFVDAYAFHWYPPAYPDNSMPSDDIRQLSFKMHENYLSKVSSVLSKTGKQFWFDELNFTANLNGVYLHEYVKQGWSGTQLAQLYLTNVNHGVQNTFLWSFNDEQWPLLNTTSGEFKDGVHLTGLFPVISQSLIPYKQYYAYTLLTKYFATDGSAKAYKATDGDGILATMIKNSNDDISIAVVNTNTTRKEFMLNVEKTLGGKTLYRHLYNPETVVADENASIIGVDKTFLGIGNEFVDSLPAGGVAVYTSIP